MEGVYPRARAAHPQADSVDVRLGSDACGVVSERPDDRRGERGAVESRGEGCGDGLTAEGAPLNDPAWTTGEADDDPRDLTTEPGA